jgi:hypothetical protein
MTSGLLLLTATLWASGCAPTLNQTYQRLDRIPEGKAVVYLYRTPFIGGAFVVDVTANGVPVNSIHTSTYYPYIGSPGMVEFTVNSLVTSKETLSVFLKPGASYYLKIATVRGALTSAFKPLLVPEVEAEQDLENSKLLREPGQ